jgi:hypothetical protein
MILVKRLLGGRRNGLSAGFETEEVPFRSEASISFETVRGFSIVVR